MVRGRRMALFQCHEDHTIIDADRRAVGEGQIVCARREPDIVDDQLTLTFRDDLSDLVFHGLEYALGALYPGSGRGADMELDLAAVDDRKEVATYRHQHRGTEHENEDGDDRDDDPSMQQRGKQSDIVVA